MKATAIPDTELWETFRQGDRAAYTVLMERHYCPLYSYGTKLTFDKEVVKDCIQEVFLELWQRRATIGVAETPRFYLLRALQRKIHRAIHRNRVFYQSSVIDPDTDFNVEFSIEADLISRQEQEEKVRQLATMVATLSPRQKQLIYLRFYQDLDFDEIAELMELNRQSVYNLLRESLLRLRKNWQGSLLPVLLMLFSHSD
ncbi:RNA polymerase sigma factor [Spirosoma areae]